MTTYSRLPVFECASCGMDIYSDPNPETGCCWLCSNKTDERLEQGKRLVAKRKRGEFAGKSGQGIRIIPKAKRNG